MNIDIVKIFIPTAFSFFLGLAIAPFLTHYLYKYKMWKKISGKVDLEGKDTPIFNALHKYRDVNVPRLGGIVIWGSVLLTTLFFWLLSSRYIGIIPEELNFLSRSQTWIPLFALVAASLLGLVDDLLQVRGVGDHVAGGLSLWKRIIIVAAIGLIGAIWFYAKLDVSSIGIPFFGTLELGFLFIPFFVLVTVSLFSGSVIDGIDGLAGGVMSVIFSAYSVIAFFQSQFDLAAFCAVVAGATLAFLWFNIPPARFYMSETGILGLLVSLSIIAFMTDSIAGGNGVIVLIIIAFPLIATTLSNIIQVISKKYFRRKVFLIAPVHHHFEAIGWPPYKVTMRYWIISMIFAVIGIVVALIG